MVLEIKKLTFGYKKNNFIFENFDLELKKGELKTIFGKSGSGKTTLFELILGNLKQKSGEIKKSKTAMIFQDPFSSFHPNVFFHFFFFKTFQFLYYNIPRFFLKSNFFYGLFFTIVKNTFNIL